MAVRVPSGAKRVGLALVGVVVLLVAIDQAINLIAIHRPKRLHAATRTLFKPLNRLRLWAIDRFDIDRHSESVVVYHTGRTSGREYATPLCVSRCDEGFVVGDYWGPTADWFRNLKATPRARLRYQGEYHEVDAEVISIDEAHRRLGGPSTCGCWEQGRTEQCVLLRPRS